MECDICGTSPEKSPFHCPACARAVLYPQRLEHVRILLDRERLGKRVAAAVAGDQDLLAQIDRDSYKEEYETLSRNMKHDRKVVEIQESKERIEEIVRASDRLKVKIESYRKELSERKEIQAKRQRDREIAQAQLQGTYGSQIDQVKDEIRKIKQRHDTVYSDLLDGRIWLCHEAAIIHGLRKTAVSTSASITKPQDYTINQTSIPDLRDLPKVPPEQITTALTQVCRLLSINAAYLGIRLPAEITLPGPNWPLPTINPPTSSYLNLLSTFPHPSSLSNSAATLTSKTTQPNSLRSSITAPAPRPRPLFLSQPLSSLAREDHQTYALFIEGISLLAWNIAWLSRTQGIDIASTNWEDVCDIGANMYNLFIEAPRIARRRFREREKEREKAKRDQKSTKHGTSTPSTISSGDLKGKVNGKIKTDESKKSQPPLFGHRSHSTSFAFLSSATAIPTSAKDEYLTSNGKLKGWALANPQKIRDSLRGYLFVEMQGAEWEVLDVGDARGLEESAVVLVGKGKGKRKDQPQRPELGNARNVDKLTDVSTGTRTRKVANANNKPANSAPANQEEDEEEEIMARTAYVNESTIDGRTRGGNDAASSAATIQGEATIEHHSNKDKEKERKVNGWTKVKSRWPIS